MSFSANATITESHGYAQFGTLKYPAKFTHFDWVNPDAPKGGTLRVMAFGTFDTLNPYTFKGSSPVSTANFLQVGAVLRVAGRARNYKVRSGDNLTLIAKANKVDVHDLQRWNKLNGQALKVGQTLVMQDTRKAAAKKPVQYKVKKGDSLYMVAKRFNVEMQHLKRWNPRTGQALKPGQMLVVSGPR